MKRIILLVIILLFIISSISYARNVIIDLKFTVPNINVGDEFPVEISVDQVSDLKGIDILISFDNLKLEYKSILKGPVINNFNENIIPDLKTSNDTGKLEYSAVLESPGPGIDSTGGKILTVNFMVKSPGDAWVKLLPNDIALGDSTANVIPSTIDSSPRSITIGQVFALKRLFNYPNPAPNESGKTVIRCESLAILEDLEAKIFDISGELVKTINYEDFNSNQAPVYEYEWNCKNEKDQNVANGTYILWVTAKIGSDEKNKTWKISILR